MTGTGQAGPASPDRNAHPGRSPRQVLRTSGFAGPDVFRRRISARSERRGDQAIGADTGAPAGSHRASAVWSFGTQNALSGTPPPPCWPVMDQRQIGGYSVSGSRGLVTERDISLARIRWRVEVHEGNAGSERGRAGRSCRSGRRDGVQRRAGLTGAAFPSLCWLAPCPAYFCARSTSSATAAPRTGGRSVLSSQHGGLSRPALSGGSTPGRRYSSA